MGIVRMGADRAEDVAGSARRSRAARRAACTRVEMVTMRPTPAASRARHDGVELVREIGKIEMAVAVDQHAVSLARARLPVRRSAETPAPAPASVAPGGDPVRAAERGEIALVRRDAEQVEQLAGRRPA